MGLPLLVEHGWLISKLIVVLCAGVGVISIIALRRMRVARAARAEVLRRRATVAAPTEGNVTLRATYRERDGARWLEDGDQRIELVGDLRVVLGTSERWPRDASSPVASVRDGDDVVVRGRFARTENAANASVRNGTLTGTVLSPLELVATSPVTRGKPFHGVAIAALAVACGLAGYGVLRFVGTHLADLDVPDHEAHDGSLADVRGVVVAAALPGSREDALASLASFVRHRLPITPANARLAVELARLQGCPDELRALEKQHAWEELVTAAHRCDHPQSERKALIALGRYTEAAAVVRRARAADKDALIALVGAGDWNGAATLADERGRATTEPGPEAGGFACYANWLRARAGDTTARGELARIAGTGSAPCRIADALLRPATEQRTAFETIASTDAQGDVRSLASSLAWRAGGEAPDPRGAALAPLPPHAPWFAIGQHDSPAARPWQALLDVYRGDFSTAQAKLAGVDRGDDARAALALRRGMASGAGAPATFFFHEIACRGQERHSLAAAAAGDGAPLARILEACTLLWDENTAAALLAVLPKLRTERERVARGLSLVHEHETVVWLGMPFRYVSTLSLERDLALLAGDSVRARRLQQSIDRHLETLADPERVIALAFLDVL
jgi:hypothetical protein